MHECVIQKYPIPVVWLDTSILIRLARIKRGKARQDNDREHCIKIRNQIYDLVRAGKLICPEANQAYELNRGHDVVSDIVNELSLGVWTAHHHGVKCRQEVRVMRSYLDGSKTTDLPYGEAFAEDPIQLLKANLASDIFVSVLQTPTEEGIEDISRRRCAVHDQWERLRLKLQSEGITYAEQVETEFVGEIRESIDQSVRYAQNLLKGQDATMNEFSGHLRMSRLYEAWVHYAGSHSGGKEFSRFFKSSHYKTIPSVEISAMLTAKVLTADRKVRHGDAMDIEHLSTMLPYANLMIIDKSMKSIVKSLGLDALYKCKVCYIRDTEELNSYFHDVDSMSPIH